MTMRVQRYGVLALLSFAFLGCGADKSDASTGLGGNGATPDESAGAISAGGALGSAGEANASGSPGAGTSNASGGVSDSAAGQAGSGGLVTAPESHPSAMPIISHGVPAFASSGAGTAKDANDGEPASHWLSTALPAWLAYDLSGVPIAQRRQVLIAWYTSAALDYINPTPDPSKHVPVDYTLEINTAAGGGNPPASGWSTVATITGNNRSTRQRLIQLKGANWVRMNVSKSSNPGDVQIDLDVHSAPDGASRFLAIHGGLDHVHDVELPFQRPAGARPQGGPVPLACRRTRRHWWHEHDHGARCHPGHAKRTSRGVSSRSTTAPTTTPTNITWKSWSRLLWQRARCR